MAVAVGTMASCIAAQAKCVTAPNRLASLKSMYLLGSKLTTEHANWVG